MTDESIFTEAIAIGDSSQRNAFLDRACAGNPELRKRIDDLLLAYQNSNPLDRAPADLAQTGLYQQSIGEHAATVGDRVGPYKLLQEIGEGGMGTVYMAEQEQPVRRMVALKIIRAGMDSKGVMARFEAERQALALMDHPNIAKVLDAGTTDSGSPYFVMELVKGIPITRFCDENQLSLRDRLELFIPVCQAIQHAHMKGIIHRDVKPSNVLVALYDDKPVPKVIDFGVAKATSQRLTDKTMFTAFGAIVGTLEYMSPEQAKLNQLDIDTRSDVYSLGVLLYELLTGSTPLDRARLKSAALDEVLRLIREEEPPKPSTRLSTTATLPQIAAARRSHIDQIGKVVRGELDWIVMKSLEKDRTRRYESAIGLARDVERYLKDETVEACPPTLGYRLRKAYRKHYTAITIATVIFAILVIGITFSGYLATQASIARGNEKFQRHIAEIQLKIAQEETQKAVAARDEANSEKARAERRLKNIEARNAVLFDLILRLAPGNPVNEGKQLSDVVASAMTFLSNQLEQIPTDDRLGVASLHNSIGCVFNDLGKHEAAAESLKKALTLFDADFQPDFILTTGCLNNLASTYEKLEQWEMAIQCLERLQFRAAASKNRFLKNNDQSDEKRLLGLYLKADEKSSRIRGEKLLRKVVLLREQNSPGEWLTYASQSMLGEVLLNQAKLPEAAPLLLKSYEGLKKCEKEIPQEIHSELMREAINRLISLNLLLNKPDEVNKWRAERIQYDPELAPLPREVKKS